MEAQHSWRGRSESDSMGDREVELRSLPSAFTSTSGGALGSSVRSSGSHWSPEPGFQEVDGEVNGKSKLNETTVDIVAVPCIGASPVDTWAREPLGESYFSSSDSSQVDYPTVRKLPASSVLTPTIDRVLPKASHVWIRHGIRKEVDKARVLLYRHRELYEGMTIEKAADDLLEQMSKMRAGLNNGRPLFFICHSIGGLVVKAALVKASKSPDMKPLVYHCHGITFFATPHRGSSYLAMPDLRESIQELLFLEKPLPHSIMEELAIGYKPMLKLHDTFTDIASEIRIWTFYETVDSTLSGSYDSDYDETHFSAPITSIKSCLVRMRVEMALSLDSDHAHCASFGHNNLQTMHLYLIELGKAVRDAEALSSRYKHAPLQLQSKVRVEIIGFYEAPNSNKDQAMRLYVSKHLLEEFFEKGPEVCLRERLMAKTPKGRRGTQLQQRRLSPPGGVTGALGIIQGLGHRLIGSSASSHDARDSEPDTAHPSPQIVVRRPSYGGTATDPVLSSTSDRSPSPRRSRGLTVPALSTPGFHQPSHRRSSSSTRSEPQSLPDHLETDISPRTTNRTTDESQTDEETLATEGKENNSLRKDYHEHTKRSTPEWQDYTSGLSRPDPQRRKFMWIHLPFNNPYWVKCIFNKLSEIQNRSYNNLLSNEYWTSKHVLGRNAKFRNSYVKSGCAFVPAEVSSPRPTSGGKNRSPSPNKAPAHFYLYLPYLHYDTYINMIRRRNIIKWRLKNGRTRPVPKEVAEMESLEAQVIWEFLGHDPPLNPRRTFDQYGRPEMDDTWARDDDQMLYKLTKDSMKPPVLGKPNVVGSSTASPDDISPPNSRLVSAVDTTLQNSETSSESGMEVLEEDIIDGKVLMMDQLWLWAIDTTTLMTFFPKRESVPSEGPLFQQADLRNSVYNELNGDLTGRCENALDLAAFITLHAVTVLLDRSSHPDLEIFRIFEEALGILTERMTSSLKLFRIQSYQGIRDGTDDSDELEDNSSTQIKQRHERERKQDERQHRENTSALLELRDMEEEVQFLSTLFTEQQETIQSMLENFEKPELREFTTHGREYLEEALKRLDDYSKLASNMLKRIAATKNDYEKLQEMIQRQAQLDEARWQRLQADLAAIQNLAIVIFTIFTVIFLPLSFFTSLFGMNTKEWDNNFPSIKEIGYISLPSSAFVILSTLFLAYSSRTQNLFKRLGRVIRSAFDRIKQQLTRLEPESAKAAKQKRAARFKEMQDEHEQRKRDRAYDFWETVRTTARHSAYEIPESNRKRNARRRADAARIAKSYE